MAGVVSLVVIFFFVSAVCDDHTERFFYGKRVLPQILKDRGFKQDFIEKIFSDSRLQLYPEITQRHKWKKVDYFGPRIGLLSESSIKRGKGALRENLDFLIKLEKRFSVPKEYLIAIFRLETNLGTYLGKHLVINSFFTLYAFRDKRSLDPEIQLINFLMICEQRKLDPFEIKGSYMGAFGLLQSLPGSLNRYGVDGNADGKIDLFDLQDAFATAANHLKQNGWDENPDKALLRYNNDKNYVRAIKAYAEVLRN